jgi:uncharacterized protein YndB with AHSA1/START domain
MPLSNQPIQSFEFTRDELIDASPDIVFAAILDEIGPESQGGDGKPMPLKVELWPGGRWFRDLGNNTGHFWGHVQVIKPPTVLELTGPMFMSYPASNHVQYRLAAEGSGTRLKFTHKSIGLFPKEHAEGMEMGWGMKLKRVRELALARRK